MQLNYLSPQQTADYWERTRIAVYKAIDEGRLPAVRLGPKIILIPRAAAVAYKARIEAKQAKRRAKLAATEAQQ
jgi:excisionase family DNA binding protein